MREKAKAGELKAVNGSAASKVPEKKKRRWDQPAGADEPSKKKSSWDQADVGTPSHVRQPSNIFLYGYFFKCHISCVCIWPNLEIISLSCCSNLYFGNNCYIT